MDRAARRYNEVRTVTIAQVDMSNHLVTGRDQYGTLLQISFHLNDALIAVPSIGELWTVERNGNMWFLGKIADDGTEKNGLKTLAPGDRRIDTSGDIYLNGNHINLNGTVQIGTIPILKGTGSPAGVVSAPVGSLYLRTDGGASTTLYVKESGTGTAGWIAK